ncbi:MAG TPA: cytochrome c oxidase subunit 3 family protein [Gammaproteobacteria bacterium]|nr:cytochrome c oxidase subunit 3 family protein [Gammaproteobacteria bacterium]
MNDAAIDNAIPKEKYPPGDLAIWVFIYAEFLAFGIFFLAYAFARSYNVELFNASQLHLDKRAGALNTLILITSSYFVVRAVAAIRVNRARICSNWLLAAIFGGSLFLLVKIFEFHEEYVQGYSLSSNLFYTFYFSMTVFHFMHVILGMIILTAIMFKARRGGYSAEDHRGVETGASYWHMVDMVWIILFPLIYVIR